MAELRSERIAELIRSKGLNQSEVARRVGISQPSIGRLISGETRESGKLLELARALETTPEYLVGATDDPNIDAVGEKRLAFRGAEPQAADTVELEEFDVSYGLGASYIHDTPVTGRRRVFSRAWIRNFTESPFEYLFWGTGVGDSMTPTIQDADVVLIDTFDRTPRFMDKLWAIEYGGLGAIKRLRPTADGTGMRLLSSAPDVPEETAYDGELTIIGRVVAVVRKV